MTTLEKDVSDYKVYCLIYRLDPHDPESLKRYIELKRMINNEKRAIV